MMEDFWQLHALLGVSCRISGKNSTLNLNYNLMKCNWCLEGKDGTLKIVCIYFGFFPLDVHTDSALNIFIIFSFKKSTPLILKMNSFYTKPKIWRIF